MLHPLGSTITRNIVTRDGANNPVDPATIVVTVVQPDGSVVNPAPSKVSTGVWTYSYVIAQVGRHVDSWQASQ